MLTIVAEVGSNWWHADWAKARESAEAHIRAAAECGATAVKFQWFRADSLYSPVRAPKQHALIRRLELRENWLPRLAELARHCGLEFWLTPFSPRLATKACFIADVVKVSSGDLTYDPLLKATVMAEVVALSTGAGANAAEVRHALDVVGRRPILMYCVSKYPALAEDYHLSRFPFSDQALALGVSDHTGGNHLINPAVGMGYTVFEKHFRLDDVPAHLPDYDTSLPPAGFAEYCRLARMAFEVRYRSGFGPRPDEAERHWSRRGADDLRPAEEVAQ